MFENNPKCRISEVITGYTQCLGAEQFTEFDKKCIGLESQTAPLIVLSTAL